PDLPIASWPRPITNSPNKPGCARPRISRKASRRPKSAACRISGDGEVRLKRDEVRFELCPQQKCAPSPKGRAVGWGGEISRETTAPHPICCANRPLPNGER